MFVWTILEKKTKIKTRLKFSQGIVRVLSIMTKYEEARVKLTNTQINKLKSAAKNKTGIILRINKSLKMKNCPMNYF